MSDTTVTYPTALDALREMVQRQMFRDKAPLHLQADHYVRLDYTADVFVAESPVLYLTGAIATAIFSSDHPNGLVVACPTHPWDKSHNTIEWLHQLKQMCILKLQEQTREQAIAALDLWGQLLYWTNHRKNKLHPVYDWEHEANHYNLPSEADDRFEEDGGDGEENQGKWLAKGMLQVSFTGVGYGDENMGFLLKWIGPTEASGSYFGPPHITWAITRDHRDGIVIDTSYTPTKYGWDIDDTTIDDLSDLVAFITPKVKAAITQVVTEQARRDLIYWKNYWKKHGKQTEVKEDGDGEAEDLPARHQPAADRRGATRGTLAHLV